VLYVSLSGGVIQEALVAALDARGVPVTHLLRPADAPPELVAWIRGRGDALALHGYDHTTRPLGHGRGRKGEFASLPHHEAGLRLTAARRALTAAGLWTDVFVPPRWLASEGTFTAAAEQGFRVLAVESGIHDLRTGAAVAARVLSARPTQLGVAWVLRRGGPVRIHVRAKDLRRPGRAEAVLAAVDAALAHVTPTTYARATGRAA
jgi:predicted deacetylase